MTGFTPTLSTEDLRARLASATPPRLLDVRTPAEFASAHIPGSYNVALDTLHEHRAELTRALDTQVVLVCGSGRRAEQAEHQPDRDGERPGEDHHRRVTGPWSARRSPWSGRTRRPGSTACGPTGCPWRRCR